MMSPSNDGINFGKLIRLSADGAGSIVVVAVVLSVGASAVNLSLTIAANISSGRLHQSGSRSRVFF